MTKVKFVTPNQVYEDPTLIVGTIDLLSEGEKFVTSDHEAMVAFSLMSKLYDDWVERFEKAAKEYYVSNDKFTGYVFGTKGKDGIVNKVIVISDEYLKRGSLPSGKLSH